MPPSSIKQFIAYYLNFISYLTISYSSQELSAILFRDFIISLDITTFFLEASLQSKATASNATI